MNRTQTEKLRPLQTRNLPEDALLLGIPKARLEPHDVPHAAAAIFHTQLNDGPWPSSAAGIDESHGFHWTKTQGVASATSHLLDGHAPLEVRHGIEVVCARLVGRNQRIDERFVLLAT